MKLFLLFASINNMSADLSKVKETAKEAAILAGTFLKKHLVGKLEIHFKGEIDLVTDAAVKEIPHRIRTDLPG